jgi:flagellar biosynthesis anti-sigma factor FlgM
MKIEGQDNIAAIAGADRSEAVAARQAGESVAESPTTLDSDPNDSSLTLSPRAEEASRIAEIANDAYEFRLDLVEAARADLASGQLQPDAMVIATQMSTEMF